MLKHYFGKALHNYCGRFKKRNKARNERKKKIPCLPSAEKAFVNPHLKCAHIEFLCRKVVWLWHSEVKGICVEVEVVPAHLVQSEEAQVTHHVEGADPFRRGDLSCHLETDLHDLQWVGEDDLRASSL